MARTKGAIGRNQPKGARSGNGRLRKPEKPETGPCMGVLRRHELYRIPANDPGDAGERRKRKGGMLTDTCDAIGRAYNAGLLGSPDRAQERLLAGRKIARQYWTVLGYKPATNTLARFQPQMPSRGMSDETFRIMEEALSDALDLVKARGWDHRKAFDQLCIDPYPDEGPAWLTRIVLAHRDKKRSTEADYNMLRLAVEGLDAIA